MSILYVVNHGKWGLYRGVNKPEFYTLSHPSECYWLVPGTYTEE